MYVIDKRRILVIVSSIVFSIFFVAVSVKKVEKTVMTATSPVCDRVVILDAGHGLPDEGAESSNGTTESQINLNIVLKVQKLLEQSGCSVVLTRSDENGIYDIESNSIREKKVSDIKNRVKIGNESSGDIFVSIHLNKIPQSQYYGWQTFYNKRSEEGKKLAECLQNGLNDSIDKDNNRVPLSISGKYIVDNVEIPMSIVECGFLSNPEEEKLLQTDEYQSRIAWGIYLGIQDYFEQ
ncbi:MAG: N-acetylmuramoyl-L-alanine amidase [Clostridia bacterium]|nr:N-acetylmuramoyl-L-alanine amidase [Clostridia bacterium]MBR3152209.1 N-acetylmuramoyl-L-alanine amidase [Clostridia bacterium]MBR3152254.1 N-acetylmuramoyl-L-alanine amidase [Clostridia bacterium]